MLLGLPVVVAAAAISMSAAQACGPPGGGGMGGGDTGGGDMGGGPAPSISGGHSGGGGSTGGWDNGDAQRMRQGVDDATRGNGGDDSGGGRSFGGGSSSGAGGGGADFSSQISSLRTPEAKPDPPAPQDSYDIPVTGGGNNVWWTLLTGDNGLEHSLTDKMNANAPEDPRYRAQMDKPWYQRAWEGVQAMDPPGHEIPETGGGNNVWWAMLTGDDGLERTLQPPPDTSPEGIKRAEQWKAYNDLPWYQRWTTPNPDYHPPPPKPIVPPRPPDQPSMGRNG